MSYSDPTPEHQAEQREIAQARTGAAEALASARASAEDPDSLTLGESPYSKAHALVSMYYDKVRPYRHAAPEMWEERDLGTISPPRVYEQEAPGDTRATESYELVGDVPERIDLVGLGSFERWRTATLRYRGSSGAVSRRVWLPVTTLEAVTDALGDALVEANLAADIEPPEARSDPL